MMFKQRRYSLLMVLIVIFLVGCGGAAQEAPTATAVPPTNTSAPSPVPATDVPTAVPEPPTETAEPAAPTSEPTPTVVTVKVTLEYVQELETIEEFDPIERELDDVEGILAVSGNEQSITITYDPEILTEEDIRQIMDQIGSPVQ